LTSRKVQHVEAVWCRQADERCAVVHLVVDISNTGAVQHTWCVPGAKHLLEDQQECEPGKRITQDLTFSGILATQLGGIFGGT
jgi:hypothetical protein